MKFIRSINLTSRFFILYVAVVLLFVVSFVAPALYFVAQMALAGLILITIFDLFFSYNTEVPIHFVRKVNQRCSLGDDNKVALTIVNKTNRAIHLKLYEGFPVEMQERQKVYSLYLKAKENKVIEYNFKPTRRGLFSFLDVQVFCASEFNLVNRKIKFDAKQETQVYPSVQQMKKFDLLVFRQKNLSQGIKKIRRIGQASEFEQIRTYVQGDEFKTINWKATSRTGSLMVNQYQEEKSQPVYCIIDKSRTMQHQFEGMTLLDYAINASLVISNIAIRKGDKVGLLTFSNKIGTQLNAERTATHLRRIQQALYDQKTHFLDPSFELMFHSVRQNVKNRSLLLLFTNFDTEVSMRRNLPILLRLNQQHLLVVVMFQNTELQDIAFRSAKNTQEIYNAVIAERMLSIKNRIAQELNKNGIQTLLTHPEDLSLNTINKYLEIKAKGAL